MYGGDEGGHRGVDRDEVQSRRNPVRWGGYEVDIVHEKNGKQGGVAMIHRQAMDWSIESIVKYGYNTISAALVSGKRKWKWSIIGTYVWRG